MPDNLTAWLTISDAAQHLTHALGRTVTPAHVLRLGLDGHLKLSVSFPNLAQARRYVEPDYTEEYEEYLQTTAARAAGLPDPTFERRAPTALEEECARVVVLRDAVYDLPLIGGERLDVEQQYQSHTGGPTMNLSASDGTFVDSDNGIRYQLCREDRSARTGRSPSPDPPYYLEANIEPYSSPNGHVAYGILPRLPGDSVLVVRTKALEHFVARALALQAEPTVQAHASEYRPVKWEDVLIAFISDERVQVTVGARTSTHNYAEMGFQDLRQKTPNRAWATLRGLAESGGSIPVPIAQRKFIEKRVQDIRKRLRAHFAKERFEISSTSDPVRYDSRTHTYRSLFRIRTGPSFRS